VSNTVPRRAIILAAGQGKRLGTLTATMPKCLLKIDDKHIIEHQIDALSSCGVEEFVVVTGFAADKVSEAIGSRAKFIYNERYDRTNSLYSFYLARDEVGEGFVLLNGDVLFHRDMAEALLQSPYADAALVDFRDGLAEEETKVKVDGNRIIAITKDMDPTVSDGENVGMLKFTGAGVARLLATAGNLLSNGAEKSWVIAAFHELSATHPIHAVSTDSLPWTEIDFVEDLSFAREEVAPKCRLPDNTVRRSL